MGRGRQGGRYLGAHELLKHGLAQAGLSYRDIAREFGCSKSLVSEFFNHGYVPPSIPAFVERVEALLESRGVETRDGGRSGKYWEDDERMRDSHRIQRQMLGRKALKHWGLKFDPWYEKYEPYMSKEFRRVEDDLLDCVERSIFSAVIGQVGWGKSTLAQHLKERVASELPHVILAEVSVDEKRQIEAKHIRDAVLEALETELLGGRQRRSTDFRKLLAGLREQGKLITVIVDDAQWVTPRMMAQFKLYSELEDGYRRLMGILLVGQAPELTHRLNAIRAAGWRAHRVYLHGLGSETKGYIEQRLKVAGSSASDVITPPALERVCALMRSKGLDYPLPLSALMGSFMARAHELGFDRIPKDLVEEFFSPVDGATLAETRRQTASKGLSRELGGGENHSRALSA